MHRSRVREAILGAVLTVFALVGGLVLAFVVGSVVNSALDFKVSTGLQRVLATISASLAMLLGSTLWSVGMARLAGAALTRRVWWAGTLGFVPMTILVSAGLTLAEPFVFSAQLPVHRLFTALFVPSVGLIAGSSALVLGWALRMGRASFALAARTGLAAALAFLAVNLGMEALGWQVGGPGAEERATMITVLFAGDVAAALAGGAVLGGRLAGPRREVAPLPDAIAG